MIKDVSASHTIQLPMQKSEPKQRESTKVIVIEHQEKQHRTESKKDLEKVVKSMNDFLKPSHTHLKFEFHDELQEYFVAIVDNETNEVVKEIPPKKLLDMYAAMTEYLGLLVDKKI